MYGFRGDLDRVFWVVGPCSLGRRVTLTTVLLPLPPNGIKRELGSVRRLGDISEASHRVLET